jgi:hypothetical protein
VKAQVVRMEDDRVGKTPKISGWQLPIAD